MLSGFSSPFQAGRVKPPVVSSGAGGSMLFAGTSGSNLSIANDADLQFGTGDFTVEWWQYQTDTNSAPRVFSMGTYPSDNIGVSIESGTFYFWSANSALSFGSVSLKNAWHHVAVARAGTSLRVFIDGVQLGTTRTNSANFNSTLTLRIGNETTASTTAAFGGNITNFHWVKGTAKYTANFTPSTTPLSAIATSKLLLRATNSGSLLTDSSELSKTVSNNNVTWDSRTPFV